MTDLADAPHREYSRVLMRCLRNFYALHTPLEAVERVSRHHLAIWEALLSGRDAAEAISVMRAVALPIDGAYALMEQANQEAIWALTPIIAATLACGPGSEAVCLHGIRDALTELSAIMDISHEAQVAQAA